MSKINRHPVRRSAAGVLASALVLSGAVAAATPANALPGFNLERIAGDNRYQTSARIAAAFGPTSGAILASGEAGRSVDALSANFLAGVREVPVLLTQRDRVPAEVMARLNALTGAKNVTIVGGTVAVSSAVETRLRGMGFTVTRLGGDDRYATSEEIIRAGASAASPIGLVASGMSFPDALAGAPLSYKGKHPVFLTSGSSIPQDTIDAMVAAGTRQVIILGGTAAVPASVETALAARGITVVTRLGGAGRSETSRIIADYLINSQGFTNTTFNVASGAPRLEGVDALSGGALSGKQNRALLITATQTQAAPVIEFARDRAATLNATGNIFGGPAAIAVALEEAIERAGQGLGSGPVTLTSATVAPGGNLTGTITGDFSSVTVSGCGFTNQTIGADDNATTAGRQFTLNVSGAQPVGTCTLTFTATPTGGGAAVTQTVQVNVSTTGVTGGVTALPELVSATVVSTTTTAQQSASNLVGTRVRYTFDEAVTGAGATAGRFFVTTANGVRTSATSVTIEAGGSSVLARFETIATTAGASALTVATVDDGAVRDNQGNPNPEGDAALGTGGTTTGGAAGVTTAPDLVSVGNFREGAIDGTTAVDFTFDENTFVTATTGFSLIMTDGTERACAGPAVDSTNASGGTSAGGNGTTVITVVCEDVTGQGPGTARAGTTTLTAANVARGSVAVGVVRDGARDAAGTDSANPAQTVDVSNSGNTTRPDLVSAEFRPGSGATDLDQVLFTFDEAVSVTTIANFRVYNSSGDETGGATAAVRNPNNANQVLVTFSATALNDAVGASVLDGAVTAVTGTDLQQNQQDEVGVANASQTVTVAGRTNGPDLTGVALASSGTDPFTGAANAFRATYTFDEALTGTPTAGGFFLFTAEGNRLTAGACELGSAANTGTSTIRCTGFTGVTGTGGSITGAGVGNAVLGTVNAGVVTALDGTPSNPEGAEATTGGTGTPNSAPTAVSSGASGGGGGTAAPAITTSSTAPAVGATSVTFTSDRALNAATVGTGDVTITGGDTRPAITGVTASGSTITVTFGGPLVAGNVVTLAAGSVTDAAGVAGPSANVATPAAAAPTGDTTRPTLNAAATAAGNGTANDTVLLTFSEPVSASGGTYDNAQFFYDADCDGGTDRVFGTVAQTGTNGVTLTLANGTVPTTDDTNDCIGYVDANPTAVDNGDVVDAAGNALASPAQATVPAATV